MVSGYHKCVHRIENNYPRKEYLRLSGNSRNGTPRGLKGHGRFSPWSNQKFLAAYKPNVQREWNQRTFTLTGWSFLPDSNPSGPSQCIRSWNRKSRGGRSVPLEFHSNPEWHQKGESTKKRVLGEEYKTLAAWGGRKNRSSGEGEKLSQEIQKSIYTRSFENRAWHNSLNSWGIA